MYSQAHGEEDSQCHELCHGVSLRSHRVSQSFSLRSLRDYSQAHFYCVTEFHGVKFNGDTK